MRFCRHYAAIRATSLHLLALVIFLTSLPQTLAHALHRRQAVSTLPLALPDTAGFDFHKTLHPGPDYTVTLHWSIQPAPPTSTKNATAQYTYLLHAAIALENIPAPTDDRRAWVALGLGEASMMDSEFIICRQGEGRFVGNATGGRATIEERFAPKKYAPPTLNENELLITPIRGIRLTNSLFCEFTRVNQTNATSHMSFDPSAPSNIIWAFGGLTASPTPNTTFFYHGKDQRGANTTTFLTGATSSTETKSFNKKMIHGIGMMAVWLFLFPIGVFYARYFRYKPGWTYVHACTQTIGLITIFMVLGVIASDDIRPTTSIHAMAGLLLVSLILIQTLFGIASLIGLWNEMVANVRAWIKMFHNNVGFMLMIVAAITGGLGVETLYPWEQKMPGWVYIWGPYIALVTFWPVLFVCAEIYYRKRVVRKEPRKGVQPLMPSKKLDDEGVGGVVRRSSSKLRNRKDSNLSMAELPLHAERKIHMKMYTWETLDEAINGGEMLVVGNGHYVYDISKWITSHPGGQLILHAVNGTDITNDYFHEAGFDADDFAPRAPVPAQVSNRNGGKLPRQATVASRASTTMSSRASIYGAVAALMEENHNSLLDEKEWKLLLKSRRTHVHTRLAIQRLSHLLVGELVGDSNALRNQEEDESPTTANTLGSSSSGTLVPPGHRFDSHEYRRYALIDKQQVTFPSASSATNHPVYKFKFCLLYPFDRRIREPTKFHPGQCVELQARINGNTVSRYYTVVSDGWTTATFEILVKVYPEGVMGQWLGKLKPGDKQVKIRGPFGTPLINIPRSVSMVDGGRDRNSFHPGRSSRGVGTVYHFAGGSGLTPFLQLVRSLLLPVMEPLLVTSDYNPSQSDELQLAYGDRLVATHHYFDGWAIGHNLRTGQRGAFPLSCTLPPCGPYTNLVLINSVHTMEDIFGTDVLEGAMLAYPANIEVHHFVANGYKTGGVVRDGVSGCVYEGRIKTGDVMQIVAKRWMGGGGSDSGEQKIIVCGPGRFEGDMMDALGECGVELEGVEVLPPDRYV
ncbi:hypothetical protein HDV00_003051 [Rhizophlyctis rosea]|nr:hypothetical protein HDV00_003051 [Rhizophlyctis rosea]